MCFPWLAAFTWTGVTLVWSRIQCYNVRVLRCYSVTVIQFYSVTVLQCYSVTVLQCMCALYLGVAVVAERPALVLDEPEVRQFLESGVRQGVHDC
jgi:hypothetical protein